MTLTFLTLALVFYFGACIGSFLNVVIWRLPQGKTLGGRSHCPHCHRTLQAWELFPLFSFLWLGGKCAGCRQKISWRYFVIEAAVGALFLLAWASFMDFSLLGSLLLLRAWLLIALMTVVFVVDMEQYIILDSVVIFGSLAGLLTNIFLDSAAGTAWTWHGYLAGGLAGGLAAVVPFWLVWYISKGRWMGFGDVKLAVLLGILLGWSLVGTALFLGILLGGAVSLFLLASRAKGLKSQVPLGTFLSLAAVISLLYGPALLAWYLALLGI